VQTGPVTTPASAGPVAVVRAGITPALPALPAALAGSCWADVPSRKAPCPELGRGTWLQAAQGSSQLGAAGCHGSTGQAAPGGQTELSRFLDLVFC